MLMTRRLAPLLALSLCVPMPADARSVNPKHLKPTQTPTAYTLTAPYTFREKAATFIVRPGTYVVQFENDRYDYLIGPEECLLVFVGPVPEGDHAQEPGRHCGIELPKDPSQGATFFSMRQYIAPNPVAGPLINAIIAYGEGKFMFWSAKHRDQALRALLVPQPAAADAATP